MHQGDKTALPLHYVAINSDLYCYLSNEPGFPPDHVCWTLATFGQHLVCGVLFNDAGNSSS